MPFGSSVSHCHACGKRWLSGCVGRFTCDDCEQKGHGDLFDCKACGQARKDAALESIGRLSQENDKLRAALMEVAKAEEGRAPMQSPTDTSAVCFCCVNKTKLAIDALNSPEPSSRANA